MIKVAAGCGWRNYGEGWHHCDGGEYDHLDSHDIFLQKFNDNTVDLIYASHLIAYFDRTEVIQLLESWKRVLKPGGVLRLATPDFNAMQWLYSTGRISLEDILGPLYGKMKMGNRTIYHKTVYDFSSLSTLLVRQLGFSKVFTYSWREKDHKDIDDHSQAYLNPKGDKENGENISLNVEAIK